MTGIQLRPERRGGLEGSRLGVPGGPTGTFNHPGQLRDGVLADRAGELDLYGSGSGCTGVGSLGPSSGF
jgi:hypothetical protein